MNKFIFRGALATIAAFGLVACGGGGGGGGGGGATEPTDPADEITDGAYAPLSDQGAGGTAGMAYIVLDGDDAEFSDSVSITYSSGAVSGGLLAGTVIDSAVYTNPANGEFSRIVRISGDNVFGAVGLDVQSGDLPTMGATNYNEGWVGMTAFLDDNSYVLTGDATFTVTWAANDIDGRFFNLSGTAGSGGSVTNIGTIILTNGTVSGNSFSEGRVTGTGLFSDLDASGAGNGTQGYFFGPDADELGGVLVIDDTSADIQVLGAFQAD